MKSFKRGLAAALSVLLLTALLPTNALAADGDADGGAADEVIFNLQSMEITVGSDPDVQETAEMPYELFDEDGKYTIEIAEPEPFFPYEVQFTYRGRTTEEWFMDEDDTVKIGGHTFSVECVGGEPQQIGFWVGEDYVPAYPKEKDFRNDPDAGIAPASLLPLDNEELSIDLTGYFRQELDSVSVDILLQDATMPAEENVVVSWAVFGLDDYEIMKAGNKINFNSERLSFYEDLVLNLIVGTADPTNPQNKRYTLNISLPNRITPAEDVIKFRLYGENGREFQILDISHMSYQGGQSYYASDFCTIVIDSDEYKMNTSRIYFLSMDFAEHPMLNSFTDEDVTVYEGFFNNIDEIEDANVQPITEEIWNPMNTVGYKDAYLSLGLTVVLRRAGEVALVLPFRVRVNTWNYVDIAGNEIYGVQEDTGARVAVANRDGWTTIDAYNYYAYRTYAPSIKPNDEYYYSLSVEAYDPRIDDSDNGIRLVKSAYVGLYASEDDVPADAVDIKAQLFSDASTGGGYRADYSKGVQFTVFYQDGVQPADTYMGREVVSVIVLPYNGSQIEELGEPDPYFTCQGALHEADGSLFSERYIMLSWDDSYYENGYQTIFLLNDDNTPVDEGTVIYPIFNIYQGIEIQDDETVRIYAGTDAVSGERKYSGRSAYTFRSGETIQYSAATGATAETSTHLKNYWVTFLTQQTGGAKLFVNAVSNSAHLDEDEGLPVREVFLDDLHDNRHDIFVANIGDQPLTGLKVEILEPLVNVQLDPYWVFGGDGQVNELAAFTTTESTSVNGNLDIRGELLNVTKLRLIPTDTNGQISGKIRITTNNGGSETIILKGTAGVPNISTETLVDGVRYVPYSSLIQTDNMYDSAAVRFEYVSGDPLPDGMEVRPNGEVYGVPKTAGNFTFTVRAIYNGDPDTASEKTFTLHIEENANLAVWNSTDPEYDVIETVGALTGDSQDTADYILEAYTDQVFTSKGPYYYFIDFWLDGDLLTDGTDYISEEGSTKITILSQTLQTAGQGTHTISAEFREGSQTTGTLKRAAQNYRIDIPAPSTGGNTNTGGSNSGNSSGGVSAQTVKNETKTDEKESSSSEQEVKQTGFVDVPASSWFYGDVTWAAGEGLMVGTAANRFSPEDAISQAIIVTTLARMSNVDLSSYETETDPDIEAGQWYTAAAIWAKRAGLLPDYSKFTGTASISRGQMAIMLVKYLRRVGVDTQAPANPVAFADAALMTAEENEAFQVLYRYGIFQGVGGNRMNPEGTTTRSQFAALLHRLYDVMESQR